MDHKDQVNDSVYHNVIYRTKIITDITMEGTENQPRIFIMVIFLVAVFATMAYYLGVHTGKKQCKPEMIKLQQEKQHSDSIRIKTEKNMKFLMDSLNYESLNHFLIRRSIDDI